MRAVVITEPGEPEVLEVQGVPDPQPKAGEVLIKVAATGINRAAAASLSVKTLTATSKP